MATQVGPLVNNPNDSTITGQAPIDYSAIANSLSYVSSQYPQASPLVNILTQQIANYSNNWKYYQQNLDQQTAGMPTGQAQDFMAKQGLQYSMQSLQQLQGLITGILPYMTQEMILQFQDKWFQQEQKLKQAQLQSSATSAAYQQLNTNDPNNPFSSAGMNQTTALQDSRNTLQANQSGAGNIVPSPLNIGQAMSQYMPGKTLQSYDPNTGIANLVDPNTGNVSQVSFNPSANSGQNPFGNINSLTPAQLNSTLSSLANQAMNTSGPGGTSTQPVSPQSGGASLQGSSPNTQGGQSFLGSQPNNMSSPANSFFGTNTGQDYSTGSSGNNFNSLFPTSSPTTQQTTVQPPPVPNTPQPQTNSQSQQSTFTPQQQNSFMQAFGGGQ